MANVAVMEELFDIVEGIITDMAQGDSEKSVLLKQFFVSVLSVMDGLEANDLKSWKGVALIARDDLPKSVPEINDGFLHEMWSERFK